MLVGHRGERERRRCNNHRRESMRRLASTPQEQLMKTYKVGYLIGSVARESINRKFANALVKLAPEQLQFHEISYRDLPIYSYDYDADYPEVGRKFKQAIKESDAILIVTPEYNRSSPGGLKNAIDWASRPWGTNSFANIPSGVIGTSPGALGTAVGQQHLRSILGFLDSPQMNSPEAYIQFKQGMLNDAGEIADADTAKFLRHYLDEFHEFIARVLAVLPRGA
jgi:chromate reductase